MIYGPEPEPVNWDRTRSERLAFAAMLAFVTASALLSLSWFVVGWHSWSSWASWGCSGTVWLLLIPALVPSRRRGRRWRRRAAWNTAQARALAADVRQMASEHGFPLPPARDQAVIWAWQDLRGSWPEEGPLGDGQFWPLLPHQVELQEDAFARASQVLGVAV